MKAKIFTLILFLGLFSELSFSSHVVGIRITYEYVPGGYVFRLKLYRDCSGITAPTSASICFTSASGCSPTFYATLPLDSANSGFEVPFNSCAGLGATYCSGGSIFAFEEYNYVGMVTVPPCNDWEVSFSQCCRNAAITNLVDPDFYDGAVSTHFNNLDYPTNSSPQFNAVPLNYYCAGIPAIVDYSAFDVDGDSLSYEFIEVKGGSCGGFTPLAFNPPFTYDQPLATLVPTIFDPVGGQILFTPSAIQISVFAFKVNEHRNGVLIGSVSRDDEIVVTGGFVNPDTLAGRVYYDLNTNAIFDGGDIPAQGVLVHMGPGNSYAATASSGKYDIQTASGTYTIDIPSLPPYTTVIPPNYTITTSGTGTFYGNNDFALQMIPNMNDLEINLNSTHNPIPGNSYTLVMNYANIGTTNQTNVDITLTLDPLLEYQSAVPPPTNIAGNVLTWSYPTMNLFANGIITVETTLDSLAQMGNFTNCTATISSAAIDVNTLDNIVNLEEVIIASYDPNNKEVTPEGPIDLDFIANQEWITYKVNFQNLGTAPAQNVRIADLIDIDFELSSLQLVASSRPCAMSLVSPNRLEFQFNGINLPPASQNEPGSHGFVVFRLKPKTTVGLGSILTNNANIVFDFNAPIYTNLVHNQVVTSTSLYENGSGAMMLNAYPNPSNDKIYVDVKGIAGEKVKISLFNILGEKVMENHFVLTNGMNKLEVPVKKYNSGVYLLSLDNAGTRSTKKIMIE